MKKLRKLQCLDVKKATITIPAIVIVAVVLISISSSFVILIRSRRFWYRMS